MADTLNPTGVGTFCWTELGTRDVETAKKFYGELIGWQIEDQSMGDSTYSFIKTASGDQIGGMYKMEGPQFEGVPPHWLPFIFVTNVDASAQKCVELGGEIKMPPTDIPGHGRFCIIADPTGAVIALYQSGQ